MAVHCIHNTPNLPPLKQLRILRINFDTKKHLLSTNSESHISSSLHCGNELPNDLHTHRSGCELMRIDYNLAGLQGGVSGDFCSVFSFDEAVTLVK